LRNRFDYEKTINLSAPRSRDEVFGKLSKIPGIQLIYVSALACTRHRGNELVNLQRQGVLSFLLFDEIDMITGDYINKTKQAAAQIAAERSPTGIILMTGCQSALLSTDYKLLSKEIEQEIAIPIRVHDGCRLCSFDEDEADAGTGKLGQLMYDFICPGEPSAEPSVNFIGSAELDEDNEIFSILNGAGISQINSLASCKTAEAYHAMGAAHLNIITSAQDAAIGPYLEEKLEIPWVCIGGVYDSDSLRQSYKKLGEILGINADVSEQANRLDGKLTEIKNMASDLTISVEGDAGLAKWLIKERFAVESLSLGRMQGISKEQREWFEKNAPDFRIISPVRGSGGRRGGGSGGRDSGRGQMRYGSDRQDSVKIGFAGSMAVLDRIEESAVSGPLSDKEGRMR